jgi:hypothetical protein
MKAQALINLKNYEEAIDLLKLILDKENIKNSKFRANCQYLYGTILIY